MLTEYQKEYAHQGNCELSGVTVRPLEDQVLVRLDVEQDKANPNDILFLPQGHSRTPIRYGTVVAIGPGDRVKRTTRKATGSADHERAVEVCIGNKRWPMGVKPGDRIVLERRPWAQITLDGESMVILHEEQHILAVIEQ